MVADAELLRRWRTGPRWYHIVVALIDGPAVERRRRAVAAALSDLVELSTPGQPHVTLWVAGFDAVPTVRQRVELSLTIGTPATFASALYLRVTGPAIDEVRSELRSANPPEDRAGTFIPHVTVGLYRRSVPLAAVRSRLVALGQEPQLTTTAQIAHRVVDTRTDRLCRPPAP